MSQRVSEHGFTLIELLVTLAIAAFLVALTPPLLARAWPEWQLKAGAREMAANLRSARGTAAATNQEVALVIDFDQGRYGGDDGRLRLLPAAVELKNISVPNSERRGTTARIRFFPQGGSTGGRIELARGDAHIGVVVDGLTGRVVIE
jgi:general secretion pathway protein H